MKLIEKHARTKYALKMFFEILKDLGIALCHKDFKAGQEKLERCFNTITIDGKIFSPSSDIICEASYYYVSESLKQEEKDFPSLNKYVDQGLSQLRCIIQILREIIEIEKNHKHRASNYIKKSKHS